MILPYIFSYLLVFGELICSMLFFSMFLRMKPRFERRALLVILASSLVFLAVSWSMQFVRGESVYTDITRIVVFVLLYFLFLLFFYSGPLLGKVVLGLVMYWVVYVFDIGISYAIGWLYRLAGAQVLNTPFERVIFSIMQKLILFLAMLIILNIKNRRGANARLLQSPKALLLIFVPFASLVSIFVLNQHTSAFAKGDPVFVILCFGWMLLGFFTYFILIWMDDKEKKLEESKAVELQCRQEVETAQITLQNNKKLQQMAHDFNNHLLCLRMLADNEGSGSVAAYLDELAVQPGAAVSPICTNNGVVDSILNYKLLAASQSNVNILCTLSDLSLVPVASNDLVAIIANLLDNAVEACEKLTANRVVHFRMLYQQGELFISVRNPTASPVQITNNRIASTKNNTVQQHGIGLTSVQNTLGKYNASYSMKYTEGDFVFSCCISG